MARKKKDAGRHNGLVTSYKLPLDMVDAVLDMSARKITVDIPSQYRLTCREQVTPGELLQYMDADREKGSISKGTYLYACRLNSSKYPNAREFAICRMEDGEVVEVRERRKTITRDAILTLKTKLELGLLGIFVVD